MSLRKQIAQMLLMGFSGLTLSENLPVYRWLSELGIGGVILFDKELTEPTQAKNLISCEQIKGLTHSLKIVSKKGGSDLPLLVAIDYEGGAVDRLKNIPGCPPTRCAMDIAQLPLEQRKAHFHLMAKTLTRLGFNLNFAPVVDLDLINQEGIIGAKGRSFGADARIVIEMAQVFISIFKEQGIVCCLKHFPGHGSARGDTHLGFVDVTQTFAREELRPYEVLSPKLGSSVMVMTAHVVNKQLDPSGVPATLSKPILTGLLRQTYQFEGLIISDDLQMKAIADHNDLETTLTQTINAGADMLIFGNQWGTHDAFELVDVIEGLVEKGMIAANRIEEAYLRIFDLKKEMNICPLASAPYA